MKTGGTKTQVTLATLFELFASTQVSVVSISSHMFTLTILTPGMKVALRIKRMKTLSALELQADHTLAR